MREYGYIRVSSKEQNLERQRKAMIEQGIDEKLIFADTVSGKNFNRPDYQLLKRVIRKGDTLYIKELDRLGRNADMIKNEWKELTDTGINIVVLDMPILDTRQYKAGMEKVISNIVLELLSYIAEKERQSIRKRQAEGIAAAKAKGKHLGRPKATRPAEFEEYYKKVYINKELSAVQAIKGMNLTKTTFYKLKNEYEKEEGIR